MEQIDEIVQEFLVESHENLDQLDSDLVALEQEPGSRELLGSIFRTIHTIKGTSGFLAYGHLEAVTHVGENLLSRLRDGELELTPQITSALLEMVDAVRGLLATIEQSGAEGDPDHRVLISRLTALQVPEQRESPEAVVRGETTDVVGAATAPADAPVDVTGDVQSEARRTAADSSIRVDVDLLDVLMTLVGELVLTRNQIVQRAAVRSDADLIRASQRLNLIASELQEGVMKTRMQPIDHVWQKVPRVVRDLSLSCGKLVRIEMQGRETELDRTILEATKDPLTHLVRNAVDHAIETPEQRVAAGKPAEGLLLLRAFHEGGQVNIEITDDGRGIDPAVIAAKALDKGLISADELARTSARELVNLIFLPGFSTAAAVTNVSGRGVGMDVVKTNIERIGGTIDVQSTVGRGTTFRIKIPLTLAIIPALTVTCAGDRYAIPQVNLLELVRLEGDAVTTAIEHIQGAPVHRLRGRLLPLVHLQRELGVASEQTDRDAVVIVVLQAEDRQFGLVVDEVLDTEEIVVKPLGAQLKGIDVFAGATILGDGAVALILDCLAVAQQAHVVVASADRASADRAAPLTAQAQTAEPLLVVGCGDGRRSAIPLSLVTRLEEFPLAAVERSGSREVVQYRGEILPLVRMGRFLGTYDGQPAERLQVVVYSESGRSIGLVVESILDIAEAVVTTRSDLDDHGVLGSAVVQDKITEMLDVRQAILAADPYFYSATACVEGALA